MTSTSKFQLQHDNITLQGIAWKAAAPKATVCLIHGFGEHAGRYHHVAEVFNKKGLNLYSLDLIGHGRSDGKRGDIPSFDTFLEEVALLLKKAKNDYPNLPLFLYGHSMGGGIVGKYILSRNTDALKAVLMTSPWLDLTHEAPKYKVVMGKFLLKLGVNITENAGLDPDHLSRDLSVGENYFKDPLVHNKISARTFSEATANGEWVLGHAHQNQLPLLIAHGDDDNITNFEASKRMAEKAGEPASFKAWPGARHETHNEINKKEVIEFYAEWLVQQL